MTDITTAVENALASSPRPPNPNDMRAERHAQALADVKQMHEDFGRLQQSLLDANRELDRRAERIKLLEEELDKSQQGEKIYRRKLIRLAAAMETINTLTAEADKIMRDAREIDEVAAEHEAKGQ